LARYANLCLEIDMLMF